MIEFSSINLVKEIKVQKEIMQKLVDFDYDSMLIEYSDQIDALKAELQKRMEFIDTDLTKCETEYYDTIKSYKRKYGQK